MSRRDLYMILAGIALAVSLAGAAWGVSYAVDVCLREPGEPNPYTLMRKGWTPPPDHNLGSVFDKDPYRHLVPK